MFAPKGLGEILTFYGDPYPLVGTDGHVSPVWESNMVPVPLPGPLMLGWNLTIMVTKVRVHRQIEEVVRKTFDALSGSVWSKIRTFDGGYEWRTERGNTQKLSFHAFGAALDFNASTNKQGTVGNMDVGIVKIFRDLGWTWGGTFHKPRIDPMHFQWGSGY